MTWNLELRKLASLILENDRFSQLRTSPRDKFVLNDKYSKDKKQFLADMQRDEIHVIKYTLDEFNKKCMKDRYYGQFFNDTSIVNLLIRYLDSSDINLTEKAARALGHIGNPLAVVHLAKLLKSDDYWFRATIVKALGRIHSTRAVALIRDSLNDPNHWVRENAAKALGMAFSIPFPQSIQIQELKYKDPFAASSTFTLHKIVKAAGIFTTVVLTLGIIGLLTTFSDLLGDLLKARWQPIVQAQVKSKPVWILVVLVAVSTLLTGLLSWLLDWIKSRRSTKN